LAQALLDLVRSDFVTPSNKSLLLKYSSQYITLENTIEVEAYVGTRYIGDYYGLFSYYSIPPTDWLLLLRANQLGAPTSYDGEPFTLYVSNYDDVLSLVTKELNGPF
jgi:hypothetical protein